MMLAFRNVAISALRSGPRRRRLLSSLSSSSSNTIVSTSRTAFSLPRAGLVAAVASSSPPPPSIRRRSSSWFSTDAAIAPGAAGVVHALSNNNNNNTSHQHQHQPAVKILWASQGGTAQIFAQQLKEALEDIHVPVVIQGWHEFADDTPPFVTPGTGLHVFLCSVAGVGEPPDNGRQFYEHIMSNTNQYYQGLEYAVFGLGNSKAHPHHYNAIGKSLDLRLEELGASRVLELGLGDDGDCIEDDFDTWTEAIVQLVLQQQQQQQQGEDDDEASADDAGHSQQAAAVLSEPPMPQLQKASPERKSQERLAFIPAPGIAASSSSDHFQYRLRSMKYPALVLRPRENTGVRPNLFHLQGTPQQFYQDETRELDVIGNERLAVNSGEQGLLEMKIALRRNNNNNNHDHHAADNKDKDNECEWFTYKTGDHLMLYPQNSPCLVQAYLDVLDVDRHAIIDETTNTTTTQQDSIAYPHPTGITVLETLTHCVDLGATPSPPFARKLLGRNKELNYKKEIANPRRTIIDLLLQETSGDGKKRRFLSLEDMLYNMTPMTHRYYSIASSNRAHPNEIYLTYRPVKYMTSRGILREGTATSYMTNKAVVVAGGEGDDHDHFCHLAAKVNDNPTFRLPSNPKIPILMIAGGCGVAPIRAFLEERLALNLPDADMYGPGTLYLGFRNPADEVYKKLIQSSIDRGAMTEVKVVYSDSTAAAGTTTTDDDDDDNDPNHQKRMNVTDLVRAHAKEIFEHFEAGGYTYVCGGARTLGAAVEAELLEITQEHGNMDFETAQKYLIKLVEDGRLCEDLAD